MYVIRKDKSMTVKQWSTLSAFTLAAVLLNGCINYAFEKQADGIVIELKKQKLTDPKMIKIQVCTEDVFRVIAAPADSFSARPSLIVEKSSWQAVPFSVKEQGDAVHISTAKITAKVSTQTGEIVFYDQAGRLILQEKPGGGKIISAAQVMEEETYHIQQIFLSPKDEAFYGLGQHQNNIMNYKGHNVDLWQHNIVAAVPFLVSNRNYGILWDNNSRTKFGDIRDYQPLSSLTLYDKQGNEGGLTAEYYSTPGFQTLVTSRSESVIAHENLDELGGFPEGFNYNRGSVRWSGEIQSDPSTRLRTGLSGVHTFRFYSSHYAKVWLNGELVVDCWRQNWCPWTHILSLPMEAGKRYPIKIEWIPNGGYIGLRHLSPPDEENKDTMSLYSEVADQIDYYFIYGDNLDEVISGYRKITGKAPMMPKWAMGFWQCRERYKTQQELLSVVKEFRKRQIPLDNIVQDWFYWPEDKWGDHDFDPARFPDPAGMVKELHEELNTHIMISVWPKFYVGTEYYEQFKEKGWLYMRNVQTKQRDWVGPGYVSTFYDPYSEGARELFWKQIEEKLFRKGFDAWWLDATEPDIHSNLSMTELLLRVGPTALGTSARYRNTYYLMNAKGIYEGQRKSSPNQRVFILTRSAYAGQQRYSAATWSGDIATRWYDLKAQISAGLNFCLSGIPYWTMDIGGFAVEPRYERNVKDADLDEWRELNTRWFQLGTFCPLFRVHGQFPYREMFNIAPDDLPAVPSNDRLFSSAGYFGQAGHPAYQTMLAYDKLRYRLMPYIYSLAGMVTHNDYTIMRALVMDFGHDKKVLNIGDQFMFGPALLINPVTEYKARTRQVYLPAGAGWYELKTGRYLQGGQTIQADAPYTDIPIFVKEGSIIPFGPAIQYTTERTADPIRLFIYTGKDAAFTLYEDENVNYNYEKGAFSVIPFTYNEENQSLTIGARQGEFPGMLKERSFEIVWVNKDKPVGFDLEAVPAQTVRYDGSELVIKQKNDRQ
jgi:alpha-D-xyloside xylohydrolase